MRIDVGFAANDSAFTIIVFGEAILGVVSGMTTAKPDNRKPVGTAHGLLG